MRFIKQLYKQIFSATQPPLLGRWSLKHKCPTEEIIVFNANRDHCGDEICGKALEYKKTFGEIKSKSS